MKDKKNILIINGSLSGSTGNTSVLVTKIAELIDNKQFCLDIIHLAEESIDLEKRLRKADGFIFTSGTYWDSWGSPMQKFLEESTQFEASDIFLFKPAAVIITMHSVGGKSVLSRLQGVLNTLGMLLPPMSGFVYSLNTHLALENNITTDFKDDFWSIEDISIVIHNLSMALKNESSFISWPVDRKDPKRRWL